MNIWHWIQELEEQESKHGNPRIAYLIDIIPSLCVNDELDRLEVLYPEALSLAKKHINPWLEVFFRHWYLQSQVLRRNNVKGMLPKAVELLDVSTQEATKDCPQSICAVQDLAYCYGLIDGESFINERKAVALETLERINPKWPCYHCISSEYIDVLIEEKKYQVALDDIERRKKLMQLEDEDADRSPFCFSEIDSIPFFIILFTVLISLSF